MCNKITNEDTDNEDKIKKYLYNKINYCQEQNIIVSLQKKIVRQIS